MKKFLLILNRQPYDNTDVSWNALRLAKQLHGDGASVSIFLMNDAVDLARDICIAPEGVEDQVKMLKKLISLNVVVEVCGTCMSRCGIHKNHPYYAGANKSTMAKLSSLVLESDQVLTF